MIVQACDITLWQTWFSQGWTPMSIPTHLPSPFLLSRFPSISHLHPSDISFITAHFSTYTLFSPLFASFSTFLHHPFTIAFQCVKGYWEIFLWVRVQRGMWDRCAAEPSELQISNLWFQETGSSDKGRAFCVKFFISGKDWIFLHASLHLSLVKGKYILLEHCSGIRIKKNIFIANVFWWHINFESNTWHLTEYNGWILKTKDRDVNSFLLATYSSVAVLVSVLLPQQ